MEGKKFDSVAASCDLVHYFRDWDCIMFQEVDVEFEPDQSYDIADVHRTLGGQFCYISRKFSNRCCVVVLNHRNKFEVLNYKAGHNSFAVAVNFLGQHLLLQCVYVPCIAQSLDVYNSTLEQAMQQLLHVKPSRISLKGCHIISAGDFSTTLTEANTFSDSAGAFVWPVDPHKSSTALRGHRAQALTNWADDLCLLAANTDSAMEATCVSRGHAVSSTLDYVWITFPSSLLSSSSSVDFGLWEYFQPDHFPVPWHADLPVATGDAKLNSRKHRQKVFLKQRVPKNWYVGKTELDHDTDGDTLVAFGFTGSVGLPSLDSQYIKFSLGDSDSAGKVGWVAGDDIESYWTGKLWHLHVAGFELFHEDFCEIFVDSNVEDTHDTPPCGRWTNGVVSCWVQQCSHTVVPDNLSNCWDKVQTTTCRQDLLDDNMPQYVSTLVQAAVDKQPHSAKFGSCVAHQDDSVLDFHRRISLTEDVEERKFSAKVCGRGCAWREDIGGVTECCSRLMTTMASDYDLAGARLLKLNVQHLPFCLMLPEYRAAMLRRWSSTSMTMSRKLPNL